MRRIFVLLLGCSLLLWGGCTTSFYKKSADKAAYSAIDEEGAAIPNMDRHFTIDQTNRLTQVELDKLPLSRGVEEALGKEAESERNARIVSLAKALDIAVHNSRVYQRAKEQLYLNSLSFSLVRHQYTPLFFAEGRAAYIVDTETATSVVPDPAAPGGVKVVLSDNLVERSRVSASGATGFDWLLMTGGRLSAAFTTDFLHFLAGNEETITSSAVSATLIQPLWRGAGYKIAVENLTDAERSLLYGLRDFSQFRRTFTVQIATAYYQVLQNRDTVRNSYLGYQGFKKSAERTRALAAEGRTKQADVGRLEQQELSNQSSWISAIRNYKLSLDQFKIQLGISTDLNIILDDNELKELKILHPDLNPDQAQEIALNTRLDLYNERDRIEDSERQIYLAANGLKPQLDAVANAGFNSKPNSSVALPVPDVKRYHWSAGLNLDLPLERTAQRNNYRASLIAREVALRQFEQKVDEIRLEVRDDWRTLDQAKRNYEINEIAVRLGERRVEEQNLLSELGRGITEAQVSAQNDLITAKNALTAALVGHTIARLQFWNDLGILYVKDNGQWEETFRAEN